MSTRADSSAYRHVFTSAPENPKGGGGFGTVAYAAALREMVSLIESLVESYANREGSEAHCRQFVSLSRGKAYALTMFTPLPDSPDGRLGNFWAETQVVPSDWLQQGGWDAAAAFDALSWLGPGNLGNPPRDLEPEPLPDLKTGSLERLAHLGKLVPPDCLEALLQAVAQQSRGLRSLALLEAQGSSGGQLEEVVMLLPLTVPPTSRRYSVGNQLRCLTLRTRCPVGGMSFRTDITGYPAAAADSLEFSDDFVVDLAGRMPTTLPKDPFGRDYAKWLQGVIQKGEWDQLESLYKRAADSPGASFFATYKSLLNAPSRSRATISAEVPEPAASAPERTAESEPPGIAAPEAAVAPPAADPEELTITPVEDWKQASSVRDSLEAELWKVREDHRSRIEELVGKISEDFAADVDKAKARLVKEVASLQEGLNAKLKEAEKEAKKPDKRSGRKGDNRPPLQSVSPGQESSSIEARLDEIAARLDALESRTPRSFRDLLTSSLDCWVRAHRGAILWGTGIGVVLVILGFFMLRRAGNIDPRSFAPNDRIARRARTDELLPRVQPGKNAVRVLESAARREQVAPWAHLETLAIAMSHGIRIDDKLDCALLQAALQVENPAVSVDGGCGNKTIDALVAARKTDCCRDFQAPLDEKKLRSCFMTDHLQLALQEPGKQKEACLGETPWRKGRSWTEDEAARALALFQGAARGFQGEPDSELAKGLRNLDPAQSPSLRQSLAGETLTRGEAQAVLELSWAAWQGHRAYLEDLSLGDLDDLGRFVDEIIQKSEEASGGADGGNTAR